MKGSQGKNIGMLSWQMYGGALSLQKQQHQQQLQAGCLL